MTTLRGMRRYTLPIVFTSLAVALLAVLTYGISSQTTNSSIDSLVARGDYPPAPNADVALPVLGSPRPPRACATSAARSS